jgi:malonate-semialdehyde dehydrogenase (acetylating) / methylmalonate-semialdehyde dehydrogenase
MATIDTARSARVKTLANYVGGAWAAASAAGSIEDVNPATGEVEAMVPLSNAADVDAAVSAAREAQSGWAGVSPQARARAVMALREVLWANHDEIAALVTEDMGKTTDDARGEVLRGIESTEAAVAVPHLMKGEGLEGVATGVDVQMVREPMGVVAAITPFNFPAMIPLWFCGFAIGTGNAFILKPSERDPRPAELIFELIDGIEEIPAGLCSLVHGGHEAVNAILDHPGIDVISFVGQASTARHVAERSTATGKRCQALGGAKNSAVVMPDADLGLSVQALMGSAFGAAGQRCLAASVAVLVGGRERQDEVLEAVAEAAAKLRVGSGSDETTDVCPLVAPEARERVAGAVERAVEAGAQVVLDGRDTDAGPANTMLGPTIVETDDRESEIAREELFGPLLTIVRADDLDDALEFVNGSRYGNAGSIFTTSGASARAYRAGVEAGMIGVNVGVAAPIAWFPFSGWKGSIDGNLHANGTDAIELYTRKKVVTSRWV